MINIPFLPLGIAYSYRGPLWRRKNLENSVEIFKRIIESIKERICAQNKFSSSAGS